MTSRERLQAAIEHRQPDRVPVDLGATGQTGMSASTMYRLRKALGLEERPIEISETLQMLGKVDQDLMDWVGVDVVGLNNPVNLYGVPDGEKKPFVMPDGTPTLVSAGNAFDRWRTARSISILREIPLFLPAVICLQAVISLTILTGQRRLMKTI